MNIVEKLLEKGKLISPEVYSRINEEDIEKLLEGDEFLITKILPKIRVIREDGDKIKKIEDFVDVYRERFKYLSSLIKEKLDMKRMVSLNKLPPNSEVCVIGMVRDLEENGAVIEDTTGSTRIITDSTLIEDEVIGVEGVTDRGNIIVKRIIHPDIPLGREVVLTENDRLCLFTSGEVPKKNVDVIFTTTPDLERNDVKVIHVNEPVTVEMENVRIFLAPSDYSGYIKKFGDPQRALVELVRRRHLNPTGKIISKFDPYLLKEIPDVIYAPMGSTFTLNYKTVTLVSTGSDGSVLLNLRNREVVQ
ncbi:MAG: hypothetical protein DRP11_01040 [Candidatus Aenigmatarchaeota archaeon]|nr:MAG: hypothetical protein DRP11_01040 [Candidatus Aenigmarchaeota archaeon]